mmetsp:Transcript_4969/g.6272  ORF Transcript_4969/g.6272 Transcript_4969/m.6272 type:complete len:332 (-) Transcript_4969:692-1687(-)
MERKRVVVFGYDLTDSRQEVQIAALAGGALFCSLGFAFLQEKVTHIPGFKHYEFMTFLTTVTFTLCGFAERLLTNDAPRKAPLLDYAKLSLFTMGGMYFTNWSLNYLNYTTRIVFKSSKVVPVMLVGVVMQGRRYSKLEYASAFVLVTGIALFTLGDAGEAPRFEARGIILILLGVIFDAITANYEEKSFFHGKNCSPAEVMTYASLFGVASSFTTMVFNGSIFPAVNYAIEFPQVVYWTATFATLGYASSLFILLLIKTFGATNAEIVKSLRKVLSIVISFVVFTKPFTTMHGLGFFLFTLSTLMGIQIKRTKQLMKMKSTPMPIQMNIK